MVILVEAVYNASYYLFFDSMCVTGHHVYGNESQNPNQYNTVENIVASKRE